MQAAAGLAWEAGTRVLVHICDAPAHGTAFHSSSISDDHPEGDLHERSVKHLLTALAADCSLDQYLMCLTSATSQMTQQFRKKLGAAHLSGCLQRSSLKQRLRAECAAQGCSIRASSRTTMAR